MHPRDNSQTFYLIAMIVAFILLAVGIIGLIHIHEIQVQIDNAPPCK